jgi:hypothetical protein
MNMKKENKAEKNKKKNPLIYTGQLKLIGIRIN